MQSEYIQLPLVLNGVQIGWVRANAAGGFDITVDHLPEFDSIFAAFSEESKDMDGVRLELFTKERGEICGAEKLSWDHFQPNQIDNYVMFCRRVGPHDEHEDSYSGATWRDPAIPPKKEKNMLGPEEIKNRVGPHLLTEEDAQKIPQVRQKFEELMNTLDELLPDGRCKSVTMTELETAQMWAVKALAIQGPVTDDKPSNPPRTKEEAQYQAAQNAFHAYQNRKPDVYDSDRCAARSSMGILDPSTPVGEDFPLHCSLTKPHDRHLDQKRGFNWTDEQNLGG